MSDEDLPEADRAAGAPHPRFARQVLGQDAAEAAFLRAFETGRVHHAWLLTGPPGTGKATLAWQIAKFLLSQPSANAETAPGLLDEPPAPKAAAGLAVSPALPVVRRIEALSEPGLFLLRRSADPKRGTLRAVITVDEIRALKGFFALSRPDGGWRVVIVDGAEEMNVSAANALLKLLEEPPERTVFLLVSQQPGRLLPTIRSRCRSLACAPLAGPVLTRILEGLDPDQPMNAAEIAAVLPLAAGSAGAAIRLHMLGGPALDAALARLMEGLPGLDRMTALALCAGLAARDQEPRRELFLSMVETRLARLALRGARPETAADEPGLRRLAPDLPAARQWADAQSELPARARRGLALNLDPEALLFDLLLQIDAVAGRTAAR